jgi:Ca2+-binding EF-hand superfamily protein
MARLLPAKWVWWYRDKRCQMGYSKRIYNDKKWNKTVAPLRPTFESLGLKEDDVARLHEQFLKIDKDGSGTIELWEMLDHLDLKRNRFAKRVFAIFDVDGSNEIDFKEFVVALWQYCTLGRAQLIMFAFDLYDRDSSGAIDFEEFNTMLKELYGPVWKSTSELRSTETTSRRWRGAPAIRFPRRYGRRYAKNQIALNLLRHINELNKRHDTEEVDVETFAAFVKSHPALLQPAFSMQQTLRERILGGAWWDRRSHERVKVNGMNVRIHDLMKAHLHEGAFHAFMKAVEKSDAKEYKKDADMHRDFSVNWKATVEVTGMVAQRRARQGIYETQSAEILDKYSSGKARERRGSQDDLRKVRPCVEIKLQPHAIDAITNSLVDFHTGET